MDDCDKEFWESYIDIDDLWVYDKLILSKKLGYYCGPAGTLPEKEDYYIVKPCVNFRGISRGASVQLLSPKHSDSVPDGYFWCERFTGKHISIDYTHGKQVLAVEAFKEDEDRLDRFTAWRKINNFNFMLPNILEPIAKKYERLNIEAIGGNVIDVHLRHNPNFVGHDGDVIIPIWKDEFFNAPYGDRIGFIVKKENRP